LSTLGQRIDHICVLRGWSLKKLGEETGFDSGVMSRLAARKAHVAGAPETLGRVAKAARVNVAWLMLGEGPVEQVEHTLGALRKHPGWERALAEAKRWQRGIPDEYWELAGDAAFPAPPRLDWQLIVGLVRELYSAHQRWLEEADRVGMPASGEGELSKSRVVPEDAASTSESGEKSFSGS
jgi:transcriptional regulator with XRE-family HTH domain